MVHEMEIRVRDQIDTKYKWNIEKLYKSTDEWEMDFELLKSKMPELEKFSGKLGDGDELFSFLEKNTEVSRLLDKLIDFAYLKRNENTENAEFQVIHSKINAYWAEFSASLSFFIPELLKLPEGTIGKLIESSEKIRMYELYLNRILSQKLHILSAEKENLLSTIDDCLYVGEDIYDMFKNADITFPKIRYENGNEVELTDGNFNVFMKSKDRKVRKYAYEAYYGTYKKFKNTLASALSSYIKTSVVESNIRNYTSVLESELKPNEIPVEIYSTAVDTVNNNISSLHRYVRLKKKILGLDKIHMYDLNVNIVESEEQHIDYENGVKLILEGIKPLGEEYSRIFKEGIENRWIDVFENKGKYNGAYSRGCYDSMPYIHLNYNYQLSDVSTIAHEMGHSIHTYYSKKEQPYIYYKSNEFCSEVVAITNECLLMDNLIKNEKNKKKRIYLINEQLEEMSRTVFYQIMLAEFEKMIYESIEAGNHLSADDLCEMYGQLNAKYFGPDMVIDDEVSIKWASIPHLYFDFYVYQYAIGFAGASSLSKGILEEGESAVERYKVLLKSGCSDYPINILKKAGVDMTSSKPLEDTIRKFNELLDMLENELL